jgi:hypothetical protein
MGQALGQDERFFRQIFSGDLDQAAPKVEPKEYFYRVNSPFYEFDLDGDFRSESFVLEKKDGEDWFHIHAYGEIKKRHLSYRLEASGPKSRIYKISVRQLSAETKLILLYFYQGVNKYLEMRGTTRLYFLTMDNNDLTTLSMYKGPVVWDEFRSFKGHYHQRNYGVSLFDYNKDGIRELAIKYHLISEVYFYQGKGNWRTF